MNQELHLQVITPERKLLDQFVERVTLPEVDGYVTLLPGHAALVAEVGDGDLEYEVEGEIHHVAITGGFLQLEDDVVKILATSALLPEEIDLERAKAAEHRASERLSSGDPRIDYLRALSAMHRAQARVTVAMTKQLTA